MAQKPSEPDLNQYILNVVSHLTDPDHEVRSQGEYLLRNMFGWRIRSDIQEMLEKKGLSPHSADHLLEKTMVTAVRRITTFQTSNPGGFPKWLWKIAYNHVRNYNRMVNPRPRRKAKVVSLDLHRENRDFYESKFLVSVFSNGLEVSSPEDGIETEAINEYFLFLHEETLRRIKPIHRVIIVEHKLGKLSFRQIAAKCDFSEGYLRNKSSISAKIYFTTFLKILMEQEMLIPENFELIQHVRQMVVVAYGGSND